MPGYDRTGPMGAGPMTGGGFGLCGGRAAVGRGAGRGAGLGLGRGFRGGYGRGAGFGGNLRFRGRGWDYGPADYGPPALADERSVLEAQVAGLKSELDVLQRRLNDLAKQTEDRTES